MKSDISSALLVILKMNSLQTELLAIINQLGHVESLNALTSSMNAMQFNLNRTDVNTKLQDYIEMEIESENGQIKKPKNIIITSPTQVGKTSYIIENCKQNKNQPYLFVLTCDNSKAQMKQLETRLKDNGLVSFDLKTVTASRIENTLSQRRAVFILMLNNEKQITKLEAVINALLTHKPKQYIIFHDEADTVNKADNGALDAPLSHKKWNSLFSTISARNEVVKRFWVSATPENCSSIGNITGKDIVVLPVPENYVKVSENISWDGSCDDQLGDEITRVKTARNGEVILYCVDKKKEEQSEMARKISSKFNCKSVCYNGDGSLIYRNGRLLEKVTSDISSIIDRFVPNVVVGYILMNRGISFVAGPVGRTLPPTATVMFYSGGSTTHIVGIAQKFGRICGTSRPDIQRRVVYCRDSVYEDYKSYLKNQEEIFKKLSGAGMEMTMAEILAESGQALPVRRSLDRPALKIVNKEYSSSSSSSSTSGSDTEYDNDKMHRLINNWWKKNTIIGKILSILYENSSGMSELELKNHIREFGSTDVNKMYHHLTTETKNYILVFKRVNNISCIRQEARDYINTL